MRILISGDTSSGIAPGHGIAVEEEIDRDRNVEIAAVAEEPTEKYIATATSAIATEK